MVSARPFWLVFIIAVIIVVLWADLQIVGKWRIGDELMAMGMEQSDLADLGFLARWHMLYQADELKAIIITAAMVVMGILVGFLVASVAFRHVVRFGDRLHEMSAADKVAALLGLIIGLFLSVILLQYIKDWAAETGPLVGVLTTAFIVIFCIWAMMSMKDELKFYFPGLSRGPEYAERELQKPKILDTNVIIDGRIADVCRTSFLEGKIFIPSFVLEELQHIADSSDSLRRARGRRGLDILNQMRKELDLAVKTYEPVDADDPEEVDARLVKLAKELKACIVTNDFNLNKVAELQGVTVLNVNELANALKPVVLPGEEMTVPIIKEGKEPSQGVAYLDDGTMVVVEGAKRHIGQTLEVVVTSVLQTVAGKMIFANIKAVQEEEDDRIARNVRNYSSFRPRKKNR